MLDALGEIVRRRPGSAIAAELRVAHRDLALAPAPLSALVVQEAKAHADLGHLLVRVAPVRVLEDALADAPVRVEQPVGLLVGQGLDARPADATLFRDAEHLADGFHRHTPCLGIDLLDMPCSRSSMVSFARIFLAMLLPFLDR